MLFQEIVTCNSAGKRHDAFKFLGQSVQNKDRYSFAGHRSSYQLICYEKFERIETSQFLRFTKHDYYRESIENYSVGVCVVAAA